MSDTLVYALVATFAIALVVVLYYAHATNVKFASLFPAGTLDQIESLLSSQGDRFLQLGLKEAATTTGELDDQFFITALELRGWSVTGSADTGYTVTPPVKPIV